MQGKQALFANSFRPFYMRFNVYVPMTTHT